MIDWKTPALETIKLLTSNAQTPVEMGIILFLAFMGAAITLKLLGKVCNLAMITFPRCSGVVLAGLLLSILAMVAVKLFAIPKIAGHTAQVAALAAAPALVLLAIVTPLACWLLRAKFPGALFAVILSTALAALVSIMVHAIFGALKEGGKNFNATRNRTKQVEESVTR